MADCPRVEPLLSAWLDSQLSPAEDARVGRHLSSCGRCWAEADDLRRVRTMIRGAPPRRAPEGVRVLVAGAAPSAALPGPRRALRAAGAAAALAGALGGAALVLGGEFAAGPSEAAIPLDAWVAEHLDRAPRGPLSLQVGR